MNELLKTYHDLKRINRGLKIFWVVLGVASIVFGIVEKQWSLLVINVLLSTANWFVVNDSLKLYTRLYDETKAFDEMLAEKKKKFMESLLTKG